MATPNERDIVNEFQQRREQLMELSRKLEELTSDVTEHELVIKTLEPMDAGRKCFRLVGDVLVERTVGETLPAVNKNKENLQELIKNLTARYQELEKSLSEFQAKNKIRIVNKQGQLLDEAEGSEGKASGSGSNSRGNQGVLVNKK